MPVSKGKYRTYDLERLPQKGDLVRVVEKSVVDNMVDMWGKHTYKWNGSELSLSFNGCMDEFCGGEFTVLEVDTVTGQFTLDGASTNDQNWWFCLDFVELL